LIIQLHIYATKYVVIIQLLFSVSIILLIIFFTLRHKKLAGDGGSAAGMAIAGDAGTHGKI
jgi:hypothetical protein